MAAWTKNKRSAAKSAQGIAPWTENKRSAAKSAQDLTAAKRQKRDGREDTEIRIGYYDANYRSRVLGASPQRNRSAEKSAESLMGIESWLQACEDEVHNAVMEDGLNVICLVGLAIYGGSHMTKHLPRWLEQYDAHRPTAFLRYLVAELPGLWHVFSFDSYGVLVLDAEVHFITKPEVHHCIIQTDFLARPMVSFEVIAVHARPVLQNQVQVWIVENEGNAEHPLPFFARDTILKFLLDSAKPNAVWGGKINCSIPRLAEAAARYKGRAWAIQPSVTGGPDSLALYRGVGEVECFDVPCRKPATFFGVVVRVESGCVGKPAEAALKPSQLATDLATHAEASDEVTKEMVHELLRLLWWGTDFQRNSPTALQEGYDRLHAMTTEIERVRSTYSSVGKPAADHRFSEAETANIHNKYLQSLTWMNDDIKEDYNAFKGKQNRFAKGRFNVYFQKEWGSKAFFMHLVRFGTVNDIAEMVRVFGKFRKSPEYRQIVVANEEKTEEELRLKVRRDQLRRVKGNSQWDEQQYLKAKEDFEALGRRKGGGIAQASWVDYWVS